MGEAFASVSLSSQPFDVCFLPPQGKGAAASVIATAGIDGSCELTSVAHGSGGAREHETLWRVQVAEDGGVCRCVRYADDRGIVAGSADCSVSVMDVTTGRVRNRVADAHDAPINRLEVLRERDEGRGPGVLLASGDDDGVVRLWDIRRKDALVASFRHHEDFIADLNYEPRRSCLLVASGDGTLSVIDVRFPKPLSAQELQLQAQHRINNKKKKNKNKGKKGAANGASGAGGSSNDITLRKRSENAEDELLSVVCMKGGKKVVCGTQNGVLAMYSWDQFEDMSDRFPGHPHSIDAIVKIDEDTIVTGSSDGMLRVLSIHPNKLLGLLGEHDEYPIERLAMSHDGMVLASASHDETVKLWDLSCVYEDDGDEVEDALAEDVAMAGGGDVRMAAEDDEYDAFGESDSDDGLEEEEEDEEEEDEEDRERELRRRGKAKAKRVGTSGLLQPSVAHRPNASKKKKQDNVASKDFFSDL